MTDSTITTEIQAPLVPAHVKFPSYQFVPLDIKMVTESDIIFLSGEGFKRAMILLAKSWQETPATSLPSDDRRLALLAGLGTGPVALAEWEKVKDEALSDFVICSDGRLYSRSLQERALLSWESAKVQIDRTAAARQARAQGRRHVADSAGSSATTPVTTSVTETVTMPVTDSRLDRTGSDQIGSDRTGSDRIDGDGVVAPTHAHVAFEGTRIALSAFEVGSFADDFPNIINIAEVIRRIDNDHRLSRIPLDQRKGTLRVRLNALNDEALDSVEIPF